MKIIQNFKLEFTNSILKTTKKNQKFFFPQVCPHSMSCSKVPAVKTISCLSCNSSFFFFRMRTFLLKLRLISKFQRKFWFFWEIFLQIPNNKISKFNFKFLSFLRHFAESWIFQIFFKREFRKKIL